METDFIEFEVSKKITLLLGGTDKQATILARNAFPLCQVQNQCGTRLSLSHFGCSFLYQIILRALTVCGASTTGFIPLGCCALTATLRAVLSCLSTDFTQLRSARPASI